MQEMLEKIEKLRSKIESDIRECKSLDELEQIRIASLGKKGSITELFKSMNNMEPPERRSTGQLLNKLKEFITQEIDNYRSSLLGNALALSSAFDTTLPGSSPPLGGLHPIIQMMDDLNEAFNSLGFEVYDGLEITSEHFAFDCLNFPLEHAARESMDTYWIYSDNKNKGIERLCLRPHLTGESVRYMQQNTPPFRFVYPGRVYRNETMDARHERAFYQYEALIVDRHVPFPSGKLLIDTILDTVFGYPVKTRMRTGFFPFVEPGFEIDMQCLVCGGQGCKVCKHVGWLEIMPGGPPHPNVLHSAGLDPEKWSGFYINVGLDRLVMMRYGIDDVRLFHGADLRFLSQFK